MELSTELEQFKAINMECDNSMKAEHHQLSVSVHVTCVPTMHLYLYSPYWLVNNTGLPIQIRVSGGVVDHCRSLWIRVSVAVVDYCRSLWIRVSVAVVDHCGSE